MLECSCHRAELKRFKFPSKQPSFLSKGKKEGSLFHDLPHRSHSRGASPSQVYGLLRSLLGGVSRRENDTQSFSLARRLFALRSLCDLGLITSKVIEPRATPATQKERNPHRTLVRFGFLLVAEMGFEPHDLRVMSPTSCQTAPLRDIMVPEAGVEPVRDKISRDFKSRASANSAIPAYATVCSYTLLIYYIT